MTFTTLEKSERIEEDVLTAAIELVEADAATIFRESKLDSGQIKTYEKTATVSNFKEEEAQTDYQHFQVFKKNQANYPIGPSNRSIGRTGYVLVTGVPISLSSADESQLPEDFDKFSETSYLPCELQNLGAILIVPISDYQESGQSPIKGAIRFVRLSNSPKGGFNKNDMEIAKLLARNLYFILKLHDIRGKEQRENAKTKEAKDKWKKTLESFFSKQLIDNLKNIYSSKSKSCDSRASSVISSFLESYEESSSFTIVEIVRDTIFKLWDAFDMRNHEQQEINYSTLFDYFSKYENVLYNLPRYRDHFIHQLVVYLLGQVIIDSLKLEKIINPKSWLIASTFHDIAYPLAKAGSFYSKVVEICFKSKVEKTRWFDLDVLMYGEASLVNELDLIYEWIVSAVGLSKNRNKREAIKKFLYVKLFKEHDHGLLSALTLLRHIEPRQKDEKCIQDAVIGIALHNIAPELYIITQQRYQFKNAPTAVLLLFCDALHEWGRSKIIVEHEDVKDRINLTKFNICKSQRSEEYIEAYVKIIGDSSKRDKIFSSFKEMFDIVESSKPIFKLWVENYGEQEKFDSLKK